MLIYQERTECDNVVIDLIYNKVVKMVLLFSFKPNVQFNDFIFIKWNKIFEKNSYDRKLMLLWLMNHL